MKKVYNNIIPLKGYKAIALWPWVFIHKGAAYTEIDDRHEQIHGEQQKEMLIVFFLLWYAIEWLVKLCYYKNTTTAYKNVSFEREAYCYQHYTSYIDNRKRYAWLSFIRIEY